MPSFLPIVTSKVIFFADGVCKSVNTELPKWSTDLFFAIKRHKLEDLELEFYG